MRTIQFCEIDPFCRSVLAKHWPGVPCHGDIRTLEPPAADVICGGFPCQDISSASPTGAGIDGERSGLWSEYARIIRIVRPKWVIVENSSALLYRGLGRVLSDLAAIRYDAEWHCIRASTIGAPFAGDRIYILASPHQEHGQTGMGLRPYLRKGEIRRARAEFRSKVWLAATGRLARMGHGFSDFVDRRRRTEGLGNAVVPQFPEIFGRAIMKVTALQRPDVT
jgi:DNA (cytosine-5)-methyltransferase 1